MGIGATHAQRIDARAARMAAALPWRQRVIHPEGRGVEIDGRVRRLIPQRGRDLLIVQGQSHFDQAGDARSGVGVADVGFHRPDAAEAGVLGPLPEGLGQRRHLDGVAQIGAGAVAFDVIDRVRRHIGHRLRLGDAAGLTIDRGRQIPGLLRAVVVDRGALDHGPDMVAVRHRIRQPFQHHTSGTRAEHRALRAVIEGMTFAVRREDLVFLVKIPAPLRQFHRHPARQRHVALTAEQRLRGIMYGNQRGRTRRLHVHRRPAQVEDMADAGGQEILVVAGVAQQEHADIAHHVAVRAEVEIEVTPHPAAGIDADIALDRLGHMAGVFQRFPGDLQKLAVLGVQNRGFLGREAEEFGVELREPVQRGAEGDVIGHPHHRRVFARGKQVILAQPPDRPQAVAQVVPVFRDRGRAGQVRGHPDDGDIGIRQIGGHGIPARLFAKDETIRSLRPQWFAIGAEFGHSPAAVTTMSGDARSAPLAWCPERRRHARASASRLAPPAWCGASPRPGPEAPRQSAR